MGNCLGPSSNLNRGLRSVTSVFSRNRSVAEENRLPPPDGENKDKAAAKAAENSPTLKPPCPVPKPGTEPDAAGGTQTKPPKPVPKPGTEPEAGGAKSKPTDGGAEAKPTDGGGGAEAKPHETGGGAEAKPPDGGGAESKPPKAEAGGGEAKSPDTAAKPGTEPEPDTVGAQAKPPEPVSKHGTESEDARRKPHDPSPRAGTESPSSPESPPSSPETPPQPEPEFHSYSLPMPGSVPKPGTESPPSPETTQQPEPEFHSHSLPMPGQTPKSPPSPESPPQLGPEGHSYSLPMPGQFRPESPPSPESPPQLGPEGHSYSLPMPGQFRTESPPSPESPPQLGPEGHSYSLPMPGQFRPESPPSPESPPQLEPVGHSYSLPMPDSSPKPSSESPPEPEVDSYSLPMPEGHSYSLPMPEAQSYSLPLPEGLSYSLPMPPEAQSYSLPMPEGQSYSLPPPPQLHANVSPEPEAAKPEEPYRPAEVVEDSNKPEVPPKNKAVMKRLASVGLQADSVLGRKTDNLKDHYSMGRKLGQGQFGTTYVCLSKRTGNEFACKSIAKRKLITKEDVEDVRREIQIMHHLAGHQNVIQIVGAYEDAVEVHLVMELCEGGELFDRIIERGHYTERKAAELARVICCVVQTCHSLGVMHRDLKPENFLFVSQEEEALLKTIDFGLSIFFRPGEIFHDVVGSPYYVAPEVLQKHYGPECDIWSAGVIIYILLSGVPPFWDETEQGIFEQVLKGDVDYISDPWPYISESGKELVQKMLDRDPAKRPTALEVLHHPWVQPDGEAPDTPLDSAVLGRLEQFSRMTKLKKIAIRVISENLSEEEIAGLKAMFKSMDTDGSGHITLVELKYGLKKVGAEIKDSELKGLMQAADVDNSGTIDYGEFVAAMLHLNKVQKEDHLYAAFSYFDKDGSGYITKDEVQLACQSFGLENLQLDDIIREVDQDNDGHIDYNEFVAMMQDTGLVQKK